jgi:hypothetical protein
MMHFSAVLGINKDGDFKESYSYTTHLAALIWMSRLVMLEFALPKREYRTLGWPARTAYHDYGHRLESVRRSYLISGSYRPFSDLVSLLAYGKLITKANGRPGVVRWDDDKQGLHIKDIDLRLDDFRRFVHGIVESLEKILYEDLLFGVTPPSVDLQKLTDVISKKKHHASFVSESSNRMQEGYKDLMDLMINQVEEVKRLVNKENKWIELKARGYLVAKERFLRLLMLGKSFGLNPAHEQLFTLSEDSQPGAPSSARSSFVIPDPASATSSSS